MKEEGAEGGVDLSCTLHNYKFLSISKPVFNVVISCDIHSRCLTHKTTKKYLIQFNKKATVSAFPLTQDIYILLSK